jgi:uncharacterized repeat protein (TIGR03803 family)
VTFADGQLYGTTWAGGDADTGVVFALDPRTGVETVLHVFAGPSSLTHPHAGLTWHAGVLYGTASAGGGSVDCADGCGGVFRIDAATGVEADLHVFASQAEGWLPQGELVFHRGHVFGTTASGGPSDFGTIFSVDVETGAKATLHDFVTTGQGITPGTLLGYQGALYGATHGGGSSGQGTVFRLER